MSSHHRAGEWFHSPTGKIEVAIVWRDPGTGLLLKGRIDWLDFIADLLADLKTANDVAAFESRIASFGYHRQMALYSDGLFAVTGKRIGKLCLVAAESAAPFNVRAAALSQDSIERGREDYMRLLSLIAGALQSGKWPGPDSPDEWRLPAWATRERSEVELIVGGQRMVV